MTDPIAELIERNYSSCSRRNALRIQEIMNENELVTFGNLVNNNVVNGHITSDSKIVLSKTARAVFLEICQKDEVANGNLYAGLVRDATKFIGMIDQKYKQEYKQ